MCEGVCDGVDKSWRVALNVVHDSEGPHTSKAHLLKAHTKDSKDEVCNLVLADIKIHKIWCWIYIKFMNFGVDLGGCGGFCSECLS